MSDDFPRISLFNTLKNSRVKWRSDLKFNMGNNRKLLVPESSPILPLILNVLKDFDDLVEEFDTPENLNRTILTYHRIVEAFKHGFALRAQLGDPDFVDVENVRNFCNYLLTFIYKKIIKK